MSSTRKATCPVLSLRSSPQELVTSLLQESGKRNFTRKMDGGRLGECLQMAAEELGFSELTPEQAVVVENFVRGRDVFVSLPTGSGKSLCYGVLPVLFDRLQRSDRRAIVVVVSPLISLMKDQTNSFSARGLTTRVTI